MADKKTCYIISPIGDPDTNVRKWADFIRDEIIEPSVTACGYEKPQRADDPHIDLIMPDIIKQMFEADLVIADLTDLNPNVFYELGIRHCAQKTAIHLINSEQLPLLPFDLGGNKAIPVDDKHLTVKRAISDIKERLEAVGKAPNQFSSQVQQYIQYKQLELFKKQQIGKNDVIMFLAEALKTLTVSMNRQTGIMIELKQAVECPRYPSYSEAMARYLAAKRLKKDTLLTGESPPKPTQENDQKQ